MGVPCCVGHWDAGCFGVLRPAKTEQADDVLKPFGRRDMRNGLGVDQSTLAGPTDTARKCCRCGIVDDGLPRGAEFWCRECLRRDDELRLNPTEDEQRWLDRIAGKLNQSRWSHWKPGVQPAEILGWLYLGDLKEALDLASLKRRGITAVLNCINWWDLTGKLPPELPPEYLEDHYMQAGIRFKHIDLEDRLFSNLASEWPAARAFLEECKQDGCKVLVNCIAGHNRSAALVVCWLTLQESFDLVQACWHTQQCRGCILSNHGFRLAIVQLAQEAGALPPEVPPATPAPEPGALAQLPALRTTELVQGPSRGKRRAQSAMMASAFRRRVETSKDYAGLYLRLLELRDDVRYAAEPSPRLGKRNIDRSQSL